MLLLRFSMLLATMQLRAGRKFVFEHPASASSWGESCVKALAGRRHVDTVIFDQCTLGLKSPVSEQPMMKTTKLLTNVPKILQTFKQFRCKKEVPGEKKGTASGEKVANQTNLNKCQGVLYV